MDDMTLGLLKKDINFIGKGINFTNDIKKKTVECNETIKMNVKQKKLKLFLRK